MTKSLSTRIFMGLFTGLILGSIIQYSLADISFFTGTVVDIASGAGTMFVNMIMMLVVPLVFVSIVCGVCELKDLNSFGRLGGKTFGFYIINTLVAIFAALTVALLLAPGKGVDMSSNGGVDIVATELPNLVQLIVGIVPSNPVAAFTSGNMLQVIFMALLLGGVIKSLGETAKSAVSGFQVANNIMMKLISVVMQLAPIGVFALMLKLGATLEAAIFGSVLEYLVVILSLLLFWIFVVYPFAVSMFTPVSAKEFRSKTREQILFSLSTASSNATIPVTMRTLTEKLGVNRAVAGFGVPLGATMNMGGVSIYITIAIFFVANAFGAPIGMDQLPALLFSIFLLSVGAGGVPGGGMVMIGVLIHQMGLPVEAFAIVAALDRLIDMVLTSCNVVGDTAVLTIVDETEKRAEAKLATV
ncbi:dicarboxylate/amino acid:cation symporter [Shewanella sp. Choline-02u-19]|jgi:Na+/H+-dicarboxylate symporter|uniref:dicarboxylate/amino acid:cation symporter n=1 Tax=unclassified Shewanella TaxID=196818 RepID=UPI000C324B55|nr:MULTISPECIES: dicarboxylate/amino acid:cation symporter [unclassified Shewanella]PKG55993.1 dicarboxylate/amino acid:cation symporter [Shewanella sp. GutDb-MelDb]PKG74101.1 dicarboxylate/amino acid:cation symporter [Shewanella sp. GutCb]PKH56447.1 dicarboxylate/amino acid:cation symporter [Shewanella sp. Bg11-22]PKI29998.1 dicarboxylate/amino acid:cation symporter [Shewanella sp. Choline-02u-19]